MKQCITKDHQKRPLNILEPCANIFFFFNDTATTEIYTLSLHDALPISHRTDRMEHETVDVATFIGRMVQHTMPKGDRKSTRLNSSHLVISYAVFCLKKKKI